MSYPFTINTITASELKEKINTNPELLIINVLNQQYFNDCHIPKSVNIEYERLVENLASLDKDKEIVLYCAQDSCPKSKHAYALLADLGFTNLFDYTAGIKDWIKRGFDVTGVCAMPYLHD